MSGQVRELTLISFLELTPEPTLVPVSEKVMKSEQVRNLAPMSIPVGISMEYEGVDWSPANSPGAEASVQSSIPIVLFEEWERTCSPSMLSPLILPRSKYPLSPLVSPSSKFT